MEQKINIAELLKDCPKGMELDCTVFDNITFDHVNTEQNRIYCKIDNRDTAWFTAKGCINLAPSAKCVIFPKGKTTWEGFVSPCQFKDGDVIIDGDGSICIYKNDTKLEGTVNYYCGILSSCNFKIKNDKYPLRHFGCIEYYRFATEEEKQKLFDAIKDNGYKWNEETKTLEKLVKPKFKVGDRIKKGEKIATIVRVCKNLYDVKYDNGIGSFTIDLQDEWELLPNKFDITTLKPFDRVLVRGNVGQKWIIDFFEFMDNDKGFPFVCVGHYVSQCIPYEGNEHLCGTTNDCEDFYKTWE